MQANIRRYQLYIRVYLRIFAYKLPIIVFGYHHNLRNHTIDSVNSAA